MSTNETKQTIQDRCRSDPEWAAMQIELLRENDKKQQEELQRLQGLREQERKDKMHLAMELDNIRFIATANEGNHRAIRSIVGDALFEVKLEDKELG